MNYKPKSGLNVPVITVLDDSGRVIADGQRRVIRHVVQNGYGADIVFGVGTTGEWNRIANAERRRIMEIEVDEVRRINAMLIAECGMRDISRPGNPQSESPHSAFRIPHSAFNEWPLSVASLHQCVRPRTLSDRDLVRGIWRNRARPRRLCPARAARVRDRPRLRPGSGRV